jgi:hypothetical protein
MDTEADFKLTTRGASHPNLGGFIFIASLFSWGLPARRLAKSANREAKR